jgi:hypothetical protein
MVVAVTPWLGGLAATGTESTVPTTARALRMSELTTSGTQRCRILDLHETNGRDGDISGEQLTMSQLTCRIGRPYPFPNRRSGRVGGMCGILGRRTRE